VHTGVVVGRSPARCSVTGPPLPGPALAGGRPLTGRGRAGSLTVAP
jgi:hypothetical protein